MIDECVTIYHQVSFNCYIHLAKKKKKSSKFSIRESVQFNLGLLNSCTDSHIDSWVQSHKTGNKMIELLLTLIEKLTLLGEIIFLVALLGVDL